MIKLIKCDKYVYREDVQCIHISKRIINVLDRSQDLIFNAIVIRHQVVTLCRPFFLFISSKFLNYKSL